MKNLIFVVSVCAFFSFSFISSDFFSTKSNSLFSDISENVFSSENSSIHIPNPKDSSEPGDSSAGNNPVGNGATDIANMFNERGFYKSNGFSFDEQEIINDFNGNLMYQIPLYNYPLAGDLNFNLSLNYNGSTGHQFFIGNTNTYNSVPDLNRYNINSPEWIISLNGIAVQVLNFETDFFFNPPAGQSLDTNIHALIPGYHIDGSLQAAGESGPNKINILAGDGSVITLVNESNSSYVGNYRSLGKESYYKASVDFIESSNSEGYRRRLVKLYRGDGSIFVFREYKQNFYDFRTDVIVNERRKPMMLLLEEIKDGFGHQINLSYSFNDPDLIFPAPIDGHPLLKSIQALGYSESNIDINFEYGQLILNIKHNSSVNGNYQLTYARPVYYTHAGKYHKAMVQKISNCLNQTSIINYEPYSRKYLSLGNPLNNPSTIDLIIGSLYRIKSFKNILNGVRNYSYLDGSNNFLQVNGNNQRMKSNIYRGFGRDAFYTNMVSQKYDTNDTSPNSRTEFSYNYQDLGTTNTTSEIDENDYYGAFRTLFSLNPNTINQSLDPIQIKKRYKVYPIYNINSLYLENPDVEGITKLISDSTFEGNVTNPIDGNSYTYELGIFQTNYYTGSFLLSGKTNVKQGFQSNWNYSYSYESNDYEKPITSKTETDPFGNKILSFFENLYKENIIHKKMSNSISALVQDTTAFYKILLTKQEKLLDQNNNVLSKTGYAYITDTSNSKGYYGQLLNDTLFNKTGSEYLLTQYEYYKYDFYGNEVYTGDFYPYKEGNIKSIIKPGGQQTRFFYNPTSSSEVQYIDALEDNGPKVKYKIKFVNGSIKDTADRMWDTRFPIRIDNGQLSGSSFDILSREYKNYSIDGSPTRLINQNNFLTELQYEPIHRINSITLPGDFSTTPNSIDTTIIHHYVEDTLTIFSNKWGNYNSSDGYVYYATNAQSLSNNNCNLLFKTHQIFQNEDSNAFMGFGTEDIQYFDSIYTATLEISPYSYTHIINGNKNPDTTKYKTFIYPISQLGALSNYNCAFQLGANKNPATLENNIYSQIFININSGSYTYNSCDVKNILDNLKSSSKQLVGLMLKVKTYTRDEEEAYEENSESNPFSYEFEIKFTSFPSSEYINWLTNYSPKLKIIGRLDYPDTLFTPVVHGGTVVYTYDNIEHSSNIYPIRNLNTMDKGRIKYKLDGFGNVKEKNIFISSSVSNTYKYKFNYLNQPAENLDALDQYTKFSYDGLGRLIETENADTSSTLNTYSYQINFSNYFGSVPGVVEKQRFTDEVGNPFDKYFDAVGNLRTEVKFLEIPTEDFPPNALVTDYKYDSQYRVIQVRTPGGKNIYYSYDGYGRQSQRITPDAGQTEYVYDKNSNLTYSQDANQEAVSISNHKYTFRNYDGINRLTGLGEAFFENDSPFDGNQHVPNTATDYLTVNVYDTISLSIVNNLFTGVTGYTSVLNYTKGNLAATAYRTRKTDNWNFKYYRYDVRGRVIKMWNIISGFDTLITDYYYNSQDQVTDYSHTGKGEKISYRNSYDYAGRLSSADKYDIPDIPNPDFINLAAYSYNPNSQVLQNDLNDGNIRLYYYYNNRGWISEMFDNNGFLDYTNDYFKNGNVKSQQISGNYNDNFTVSTDLSYTYGYDKSNRLLTSENADKIYDLTNSYDKDGNILSLVRTNGIGSVSDDFSYAYYSGTNKLQRVIGAGSQFSYDANGNLIQDAFNNNNEILYDYRNLITELKHRSQIIGDTVYLTKYYYDEAGNRIRKMTYAYLQSVTESEPPANSDVSNASNWALRNDEVYSRDVSGKEKAIYQNNYLLEYPTYGLDMIGKIKDDELHFYLKDHLGSIRATVYDNKLINAQDYDAWGYILEGRTYESEEGKFKFTGKERDEESFYDYFGARYYDARIGRWGQVEPLIDKYPQYSPYSYSLLNPLKLVDLNGLDVIVVLSGLSPISGGSEISPNEYSESSKYEILDVLKGLQDYVSDNNINDVDITGYWSSSGVLGEKKELMAAFEFIKSNLENKDEKVYIYGYSQGGQNAIELSEMLKQAGINVYNLITVDAYSAFQGNTQTEIPSNVKYNYNYYQLESDVTGAHGNKNTGKNKTKVYNKYYKNVEHKDMDKVTSEDVQRKIRNTLK